MESSLNFSLGKRLPWLYLEGMADYGRGLPREIVAAVNTGEIQEPLSTKDVRSLVSSRGWQTPDSYTNVVLNNCTSEEHSLSYPKYFVKVSRGKFKLKPEYKGQNWR